MNLSKYISCIVRIDLLNGHYYQGKVISVDNDSLALVDKFGKNVTIRNETISYIREDK
jgi:small nuclear ribonucleoprotein (snRNP)-like protein